MRLKIRLQSKIIKPLSYNYHYQFSSAIYLLLKFSSPEFSKFLHDIGYKLNGKPYKLFTFSVKFENYKSTKEGILPLSPNLTLTISSPKIEDFIKNFVIGSFERQFFFISLGGDEHKFIIKNMELLPEPTFNTEMSFTLNSPMVLSTVKEYFGKLSPYYLRPDEKEEINRILSQNLRNKYHLLYNKEINESVCLEWNDEYLQRNPRITKKVTINEYGSFPVEIIGIQAPFKICGNSELIKIGYQCGFGEKNSMGFGMAEAINSN